MPNGMQSGLGAGQRPPLRMACFAAGTRIRTPSGLVAVDALVPGDVATTVLGGPSAIVRWVGRRWADCRRHPRPLDVMPICVRPGAFAPGAPAWNLYLSPDHAVYVDGMLVAIRDLENGHSIAQQDTESVTYFHVELDRHDIVLAEGLPVESYLDRGDRALFSNGGQVVTFGPSMVAAPSATWPCAPSLASGPVLEALWQRLSDRADEIVTASRPRPNAAPPDSAMSRRGGRPPAHG